MALRLTGTSQASERPLAPSELAAQARTLLDGGDVAAYAALFARAAAQEQPIERFHAHALLAERGLRHAGQCSPADAARIFIAVAEALVSHLESEPCEPLLLNYAGIAFYELWGLDAARTLFKAALRLDPGLPHVRRNLAEAGRRLRDGRGARARLRPLHTLVPALARRAKRVAATAKPVRGLTLSLCMIVRDEEEMLPRCLASVAPAVDEIVIVDTGSKDRTIEIARSYGARVIEHEWTGSFAEARNISFDAATGDWIMYLDADEVLVAEDVPRLRELTGRVWREAFYLTETSYTGEEGDGLGIAHDALRVFRNRPQYRFEGRMHEQIAHTLPTRVPGRLEHTPIRVEHYGYLGSVRDSKEKSRRNIELLLRQRAEGMDDSFLHFNLGTEHAVAGDTEAAADSLERAWTMARQENDNNRPWIPILLARLAGALRSAGRARDAVSLADQGLELFPDFTDLVYAKGLALAALGRDDDALAAWQRCLEMGDAPARFGATVGAGSYLPLVASADARLRRGELASARRLLERCLDEYPSFFGAVAPLARLMLVAGAPACEVVDELERRVAEPTATIRFMLAGALRQHGALAEAEAQYRRVLAHRSNSSQVRVALAETLLAQGSYEEAAELARGIEDGDRFAALSARIELWATVAQRLEPSGAHRRAQELGVPAAELELFERWAALNRGEPADGRLGIAGAPMLGVVLETVLAMHDFDTFERLAGLLESSELPAREQRELLAEMYLRYGFLQSAAREWMAVCESGPDARALAGLARVASAHGLAEDAATLAAQALSLDPGHEAARLVLAGAGAPGRAVAAAA